MVNRQDFFNIVDESTEFLDIPQWAVIAFKPMETEKIDLITGELSLYSEDLPNIKEMLGKQFKDLFLVTEHNATNWEDTDDFWFFLVNDKSEIPMIDNTYRWVNLSSGTISGKVFSTREEAITWATRNRDWEVEGVGEKIQYCEPQEKYYVVLKPETAISTAVVFSDPDLPRNTEKRSLAELLNQPFANDCEKVVRTQYPEVEKALLWLLQYAPARLTGTGACVFAEFDDEKSAQAVFQQKPKEFFGFVAKGLNVSPLHTMLKQLSTNQFIYTQPEVI